MLIETALCPTPGQFRGLQRRAKPALGTTVEVSTIRQYYTAFVIGVVVFAQRIRVDWSTTSLLLTALHTMKLTAAAGTVLATCHFRPRIQLALAC